MITFHDIILLMLCFFGVFTSVLFFIIIFSPRKVRYELDNKYRPKVTIIVPIWNEGSANGERLRKTLDSLLNCNYPKDKLEIIVVNDGSTDNSLSIANQYKKYGIRVLSHKKSKGKTHAINMGMKYATGELVAGLDADSFIMPDVLDKLVPCFKNPKVMAAVPSIKIWQPKLIIQKIQAQEFLSAVFIRHIQSELGGVPLAPGAFTLVRKTFLDKHGLLRTDTMVEDLELSMRIQSEHYLIETVVDANVYTSGVTTLKAFINQRIRWFCGFIIQMRKYKHMLGTRYGNLGVFILPSSIFYILITVFMFVYSIVMMVYNLINWLWSIHLVGFSFKNLIDFSFDPFYMTIGNTTILPILLFFVLLTFMWYVTKVSEEKQGFVWSFLLFSATYWILGAICWILAIYYYVTSKKIKWGPNYFST